MAALRIDEGEPVEEGVQKFFDLLTRLQGADLNYSQEGRGARGGRGRGRGGRGGRGSEAASMKGGDYDKDSTEDRYPGQFFFVSTQAAAAAGGFKCVKGPAEESVGEEERRRFHSLVGSLMYAAVHTRPDAAFAIGQLARVVQCPNEEQLAAGERVAKYLGQTATVGLQYSAAAQRRRKGADGVEPGRLFLTAFSDASWASEPEDMTSVGGFICYVGGGPTAWESKKQVDQALSSVESE
ncbi:hypothetical protein CLOP_g3322 [Closterium sp. NIES-67]|nr:hypothetical protein CLOP_g3322 [Closterium sp. NIES-67]